MLESNRGGGAEGHPQMHPESGDMNEETIGQSEAEVALQAEEVAQTLASAPEVESAVSPVAEEEVIEESQEAQEVVVEDVADVEEAEPAKKKGFLARLFGKKGE
jgi:hypothetical protein